MSTLSGLFLGLSTVDLIFDLPKFPSEDSKNTARRHIVCAGGPASNAAVTFAFLDGTARLISAVGESGLGRIVKNDLSRHGVEHIDLTSQQTSDPIVSTIIVSGKNGARTVVTSPVNDRSSPVDPAGMQLDRSTGIILFDGYEIELAVDLAKRARQLGIRTVLDGDVYRPKLERLLEYIDVVIFGQTFTASGLPAGVDPWNYFKKFGIAMVAGTRGSAPSEFVAEGISGEIPVTLGKTVDTLGAGDILHGAFCYYYGRGAPFRDALTSASKVASASVSSFGTRDWMHEFKRRHFD